MQEPQNQRSLMYTRSFFGPQAAPHEWHVGSNVWRWLKAALPLEVQDVERLDDPCHRPVLHEALLQDRTVCACPDALALALEVMPPVDDLDEARPVDVEVIGAWFHMRTPFSASSRASDLAGGSAR